MVNSKSFCLVKCTPVFEQESCLPRREGRRSEQCGMISGESGVRLYRRTGNLVSKSRYRTRLAAGKSLKIAKSFGGRLECSNQDVHLALLKGVAHVLNRLHQSVPSPRSRG
ncbi:hypothetical protein LIA77_08597 [Sarocladium implicatum]|nr:hypothetical protein LIA77_08597 [Sarocladium implicatum]